MKQSTAVCIHVKLECGRFSLGSADPLSNLGNSFSSLIYLATQSLHGLKNYDSVGYLVCLEAMFLILFYFIIV